MAATAIRGNGITVERVEITPDIAAAWLGNQSGNRNLDIRLVGKYAEDMSLERWLTTSETIKFDTEQRLIDGQHRLSAIVQAGVPVEMMVARGEQSEVFKVIDTGRPRSAAQALRLAGYSYWNALAAVLKWIIRYELGTPGSLATPTGAPSNGAVFNALSVHPAVEQSILVIAASAKDLRPIVPDSISSFVHYMGSRSSGHRADEFIDSLATGIALSKDSPIRQLRRALTANASAQRKLRREHLCALVVKAWLFYESGKPLGLLKWLNSEGFPVFKFDKRPRPPKA